MFALICYVPVLHIDLKCVRADALLYKKPSPTNQLFREQTNPTAMELKLHDDVKLLRVVDMCIRSPTAYSHS